MCKETTSAPAICHLTGGPQDGARHTFTVLPHLLVDIHDGGYYQLNTEVLRDGAHVFEYRPPTRSLRHPARLS